MGFNPRAVETQIPSDDVLLANAQRVLTADYNSDPEAPVGRRRRRLADSAPKACPKPSQQSSRRRRVPRSGAASSSRAAENPRGRGLVVALCLGFSRRLWDFAIGVVGSGGECAFFVSLLLLVMSRFLAAVREVCMLTAVK